MEFGGLRDFRVADAECLMDEGVKAAIAANGVTLIGFRPLREAMRGMLAAHRDQEPSGVSSVLSPELPAIVPR